MAKELQNNKETEHSDDVDAFAIYQYFGEELLW